MAVKRIFISYAREDFDPYVTTLRELLTEAGFEVYLDQDHIRGGDNWFDWMNEAVRSADLLLLCVSSPALNSRFVRMEYRYFIQKDKPLIPVICHEVEDDRMPIELMQVQWVPFAQHARLLKELKALV